jgi:hypothetical protein
MAAPKPIVLTQRSAVAGENAPEPLVVVGSLPAGLAPAVGTAALLTAGTDTALRTWSAKMIADYVAAQIAAIPA